MFFLLDSSYFKLVIDRPKEFAQLIIFLIYEGDIAHSSSLNFCLIDVDMDFVLQTK